MSRDYLELPDRDYLELPDMVGEPPSGFSDCYVHDADAGIYRLSDEAKQLIEQCKRGLEQVESETARKIGKMRAEHAILRASLDEIVIERDLREALLSGGCRQQLLKGAISLLRAKWKFEVEEDEEAGYRVAAVIAEGSVHMPISAAAETWLLSDSGMPFCGRTFEPAAGSFASRMSRAIGQ